VASGLAPTFRRCPPASLRPSSRGTARTPAIPPAKGTAVGDVGFAEYLLGAAHNVRLTSRQVVLLPRIAVRVVDLGGLVRVFALDPPRPDARRLAVPELPVQILVLRLLLRLAEKRGRIEMPSHLGGWAPAASAAVGRKSQNAQGWLLTVPAAMSPATTRLTARARRPGQSELRPFAGSRVVEDFVEGRSFAASSGW